MGIIHWPEWFVCKYRGSHCIGGDQFWVYDIDVYHSWNFICKASRVQDEILHRVVEKFLVELVILKVINYDW